VDRAIYAPHVPDALHAPVLAATLLNEPQLQRRWKHVQAVAARATELAPAVDPDDRELLVASAWLHDIGYAPSLIRSGLHSLDGARYLYGLGLPLRLCALVAQHSGARFEAAERGLTAHLDEFPIDANDPVADALAAADLTIGPDGNPMTVHERIAEILIRYPSDSPVHHAVRAAQASLISQVTRALDRM
jgi:putative nucleotidyltransferase with HDIG domain